MMIANRWKLMTQKKESGTSSQTLKMNIGATKLLQFSSANPQEVSKWAIWTYSFLQIII